MLDELVRKEAFQLLYDRNQSEVALFQTSVTLLPGCDLHHVKSRMATGTLFLNKTFQEIATESSKKDSEISFHA